MVPTDDALRPKPADMLREILIRIALICSTILVLILGGEASMRVYRMWKYSENPFRLAEYPQGSTELDRYLGWKTRAHFRRPPEWKKDAAGRMYLVSFSQHEDGFRAYGSLNSTRPRIFVVGDSYTQAEAVSDDQTYYAHVGESLGAEIFAYGVSGYGTLQEYMIVDRYIDQLHPSLILWQFCTNDFLNNSRELESGSVGNNPFVIRPYWEDGRIVWAFPINHPVGRFVPYWIQHSRLFRASLGRVRILFARYVRGGEVYQQILEGKRPQEFATAVAITNQLIAKLKQRAGSVPIVAFDCEGTEPYHGAFKALAARHGIPVVQDVNDSVLATLKKGVSLRAGDGGHWNPAGHKLVGEVITNYLRQHGW
jgi:hypothetical protein